MDTPSLEPCGAVTLLPAAAYRDMPWEPFRLWCHYNARYGLPTVELVDWLKAEIGERSAIEIGAGAGDLCHHLGIPGYDNYQQEWADVAAYYRAMGQPTIRYGAWVKRRDALIAVQGVKPSVCIGSWVTNWIDPNKPPPPGGGNMYGVKEDEILRLVDAYILIGNLATHSAKPIMRLPHEEHKLDFLVSRAAEPELDRVFIWRGRNA